MQLYRFRGSGGFFCRGAALLVICAVFLVIGEAEGRSRRKVKRAEAIRAYKQATKLYNEGRYGKAIAKYKKAYKISKKPVLLFNIASSYERMGRFKQSVEYYRRYLRVCPEQDKNQIRAKIDNISNRPSELRVITSPTGAKVWINGKAQSQRTPASFNVAAGKVTLRVRKKGYVSVRRIFKAAYGRPIFHSINLERLPPRGTLKVKADVADAEVWLDGKLLGKTPLSKTIPSGKHRIVVKKSGRRDVVSKINLVRGGTYKMFAELYRVARGQEATGTGTVRGAGQREQDDSGRDPHLTRDGKGGGQLGATDSQVSLKRRRAGGVSVRRSFVESGGFIEFEGGISVVRFGGAELEVDPTFSVGLSGGYLLRLTSRLGLEFGGQLGLSSLEDNTAQRSNRLTFLDLMGFAGLRVFVIRNLFVTARAAMGVLIVAGLDEESFLLDIGPNDKVHSPFSGFAVGGTVMAGYRVWEGLSVCVVPASLYFSPRFGSFEDLSESIEHIFRFNAQIAVLYDF
jgi:hypothetical protein